MLAAALATLSLRSASGLSGLLPTLPAMARKGIQTRAVTATMIEESARALFEYHDNDVMNALFEPSATEQVVPISIDGAVSLPPDLPPGALLRLGPNPQPGHECPSFLDGDGMVHAITVPPQQGSHRPMYSRTYVRARGFAAEEAAGGKQLFSGTLVAPRGWPMLAALVRNAASGTGMILKDTANTALSLHGGKLLALMEQSRPSELSLSRGGALRTLAASSDLGGAVPFAPVTGGSLSAHSRVDPRTGEKVVLTYSTSARPFLRHDVFAKDGRLRLSEGVDLRAPVMVHDLAITANHTIVLDFPMTVRIGRTVLDKFPVEYEPGHGARIGVVPRPPPTGVPSSSAAAAVASGVIWVDVPPCVVLHTANAHVRASDGRVVVTGLRAQPRDPQSFICKYTPSFLHEWVLDISSGKGRLVSERYLSPTAVEFPQVNPAVHGSEGARWVFCIAPRSAGGPLGHGYRTPSEGIVIDGLVRLDLAGEAPEAIYRFPRGTYVVSEPTFVARGGGGGGDDTVEARAEDDGFVLLVVSQVQQQPVGGRMARARRVPGGSALVVFDAAAVEAGPVAEVPLPADIPYGLHSCYVPWADLDE